MNNRYEITFREGGVDELETIITGGIAKIVEKTLDNITGDDDHGWYCKIEDSKTKIKVEHWGATKTHAQEKAFKELKDEIENFEYKKRKEYERLQLIEKEKQSSYSSKSSTSSDDDGISLTFFLVKWGIIITIAIVVIMIAIFLAPLVLLIWYLIGKREMQWVAIVGMIFSGYLIYDITSGGFITSSMMKMQRTGEEKYIALGYFLILVITLGFFIDKYTSLKIPVTNNGNFFEQKNIKERRPFIAGFSTLLLVIFSVFQFVAFSGGNNNNVSNTNTTITNSNSDYNYNLFYGKWNIRNKNNSSYNFYKNGRGSFTNNNGKRFDFNWSISNRNILKIKLDIDNSIWNWNIESFFNNRIVMFSKQHNERRIIFKSNNNSIASNGKSAIITDPDGYTNVRVGKGTNTSVIYKLKTNENFTVYPSNEKWWEVRLNNGVTGYIFNDRVQIINNNLNGKYPIATNKVLTDNDLENLSRRELQIMRNEIFARHGFIFKNGGEMDRYFKNTNWYNGRYNNVDNRLSEIEKKNINFIKNHENSANNINIGYTKGTNVIMRDNHSTQSKVIGSFKNSGERITILDSYYPNNSGETLIQRNITVRTNIGSNYNLQKGKSVKILSRKNGNVKIQFKDKELRSLTASINEKYLDKSVNSIWYKVKRNSGEIGWVFGKFINL